VANDFLTIRSGFPNTSFFDVFFHATLPGLNIAHSPLAVETDLILDWACIDPRNHSSSNLTKPEEISFATGQRPAVPVNPTNPEPLSPRVPASVKMQAPLESPVPVDHAPGFDAPDQQIPFAVTVAYPLLTAAPDLPLTSQRGPEFDEFPPFLLDELTGAPLSPPARDCILHFPAEFLVLKRGVLDYKTKDSQIPAFMSVPMRLLPVISDPVFSFATRARSADTDQVVAC
jgi:hypothetical protein